jgi:hypothetical protein
MDHGPITIILIGFVTIIRIGAKISCATIQHGHWRPFEDRKLWKLVMKHGVQSWNLIAQQSGVNFLWKRRLGINW